MIFGVFSSSKIKGLIKFHNLVPFWKSLSFEEQEYLRHKYNSGLGVNPKALTDIDIDAKSAQSKLSLLTIFLQSPKVNSDEILYQKIIFQAENSIPECQKIDDIHFYFQQIIIYYYRKRIKKEFYDKAKESCLRQIKIAPEVKKSFLKQYGYPLPRHYGFKQYSIILQKEKKYDEAISICTLAHKQEWNGDWEKRIERLKSSR